jgi:hypothetical protein
LVRGDAVKAAGRLFAEVPHAAAPQPALAVALGFVEAVFGLAGFERGE